MSYQELLDYANTAGIDYAKLSNSEKVDWKESFDRSCRGKFTLTILPSFFTFLKHVA